MSDLKLGQLIETETFRDAFHIAVAPVTAGEKLSPGDHIGFLPDGAVGEATANIGIVDPFLKKTVKKGDKFWLFLYPNTVTSLRHNWEHPAFSEKKCEEVVSDKSFSEKWMRQWAVRHMGIDYYGEGTVSEDKAYNFAIEAGHNHSVGPYESARDYIDDEWWGHWEKITGGKRGVDVYFSCAC